MLFRWDLTFQIFFKKLKEKFLTLINVRKYGLVLTVVKPENLIVHSFRTKTKNSKLLHVDYEYKY